ncbi:hypothetical protein SAMN05428944_1129 [Streptomyces sp. 1222.5]|nr:hypothetical protein BX260_6966 [Streptomyces sp. 5112.2]SEB73377.1 hypothetical protein SAMN05428944_1129 [Streptomyces sp. 1222.5]
MENHHPAGAVQFGDAESTRVRDGCVRNSSTGDRMAPTTKSSPRYLTKSSSPRKSRAISTAWAGPRGRSWGLQVTSRPNFDPSPTACPISAAVSPTIIPTSVIPASARDSNP